MDAQVKKGLLEICVLVSLKHGDSYGYKIINDVMPFIEISESTLYPILKRLESGGAVSTYSQIFNGRLRKYYCITDIGKEKIKDYIQDIAQIKNVHEYICKEGV